MLHITHYLPELDDPERSFLAQLTATMPEADVQHSQSLIERDAKILKQFC